MRFLVLCLLLFPSAVYAAENPVLAAYPVVVACFLIVVLALFFYDTSRRRNRDQMLANTKAVAELEKKIEKIEQEKQYLQEAVTKATAVTEVAPCMIWQRGKDLSITYCNHVYLEAIQDIPASEGVIPELARNMQDQAKKALEEGVPVSEHKHLIAGGERKLYEVLEIPDTANGTTVGFAFDLTEVEELKEDLQRHNSAMNDFLESSASAMAIYGGDMRLKSFNYAFVALWKLEESWLDTHPTYGEILEALREKRKLPEQANFQLFKQQQQKLFQDLIEPREEFFYLPDGKALRVLAIPHALGGIMFAYEDVTDRLALERSYNTLIAVQRETLDNLHEGVAVFGEDGRLKLSNPNYIHLWKLTGEFAKSEPHMRDIMEKCKKYFQFDEWDGFKQEHIEHVQARQTSSQKMERTDGKVIDWRKVPLPDGATLITYLDVTDTTLLERSLRERNEALQEADRLKSEFLANVSYELRSPLTSIAGFSEMLGQEYFGPLSDKQKEYVEGIHQSSQRLMQLINDILDLASIEAGYMQLEVARFDIHVMMKAVSSLIQGRAKDMGIKFKLECPAKIGKILGDETRIKQISFNLLSNAFKYAGKGQTVTFGAKAVGEDDVLIWVEDQGQGIPLEEQEAIFGKFYKGRPGDPGKPKSGGRSGTGLGLSIVKSFIELHGGQIKLISEPGKGARFECLFKRENIDLIGNA